MIKQRALAPWWVLKMVRDCYGICSMPLLTKYALVLLLIFCGCVTIGSPQSQSNANESLPWRTISFPFDDRILKTVMFDSANGWVLSREASRQLYRLQDGNWQIESTPADLEFWNVFGFSANNVWFVCFDKKNYRYFLRHQQGQAITDHYPPNADPIEQMDFLAPDNIWAACQWGQILHFDGTCWRLMPCPTFGHIKSISMANDSCGWASGKYRDTGFLLHWNGRNWQIKMQLKKDVVPNVAIVNDTLGYGFLNDDSWIIKLTSDQWNLLPFASLIQDTVVASWQDVARPIFFNDNGIVTGYSEGPANLSYANRQQEILWYTSAPDKPETKFYLLMPDGRVYYVRPKMPKRPKFFRQYTENLFRGTAMEYGVAFGDIDSDGDDDIYSVNTSDRNRVLLFNGNRRMKAKKTFVEGAEHLNLLGPPRSKEDETVYDMGVTIADMDNDGDRDLYITSMYEKNALFENIKNQTFRNVAVKAGISGGITRSQVGIWGDVDNDGAVDLFVTNEDTTNMLFINNGFGRFKEITPPAGLTSQRGGKSATFGDLDGDGDVDLVVTFFNLPNRVYRNEGIHPKTGLPFFRDMTDRWLPHQPDSLAKSTAACLADIDNDGDLDLYICNLVSTNRLYENDGTGCFTDITEAAGLLDSCLTSSACFFDADNDGDLDLFLSNRGYNLFFKNLGNKKFIRHEKAFKLDNSCYSNGVAWGDPDNDGDVDLYVANNDAESIYYENQLNDKNYLEIKLIGTKSNRDAIGAKAFLYEAGHLDQPDQLRGMREVNGGYGYGCMNSTTIHFGVSSNKTYDVKICFPSGITITRTNLSPGQLLMIEEQAGWAKFFALRQQGIMRSVKSQRNQIEFFKFITLMMALVAASIVLNRKGWIAVRTPLYLPIYPLIIYLIFIGITSESNFWLAFLLPMSVAMVTFVGLAWLQKIEVTQSTQERLAEELLVSCKAFDHGSWATSCLNQLQLFSVNLPPNQPISEKVGSRLKETIVSFYGLVFKELGHIHQLAQESAIQLQLTSELDRQRLLLSANLEKIKVAMALKKGVPAELLKNIYRLSEQIKLNVRELTHGVSRWFTCDAGKIIQTALSAVEDKVELQLNFATGDMPQQECWVFIKANELAAILDNLLQNAQRAMMNQHQPKITLKLSQTDRHVFIEFSDNGCGIPKKLWDTIFEEGYSTKSDPKGGFGLYYSKRTLEKYGGNIEVTKSARNKGTTFIIKLRRA